MKKSTKARIFGAVIILINLIIIGKYNLSGIPVLIMTIGFAVVYENIVVNKFKSKE